jgi:hypothetical protein
MAENRIAGRILITTFLLIPTLIPVSWLEENIYKTAEAATYKASSSRITPTELAGKQR